MMDGSADDSLVVRPSWSTLAEVVRHARESLLLCSPYMSHSGLERVFDYLVGQQRLKVRFVTRLSPSDWASGASSPDTLATIARLLADDRWPVSIQVHQRLHAKLYAADSNVCLLASSNLTSGGFESNLELGVSLSGDAATKAVGLLDGELDGNGRFLEVDQLEEWVKDSGPAIEEIRRLSHQDDAVLAASQRSLDQILGLGGGQFGSGIVFRELATFEAWLGRNHRLLGAGVVLERSTNANRQNLQGHIKQAHFAAQLFFAEYPQHINPCAQALERTNDREEVPRVPTAVLHAWLEFIDSYATYRDENGDFAVLRGILPPSLGGTRGGGGGGSSSLKRVLPLVARFLRDTAS